MSYLLVGKYYYIREWRNGTCHNRYLGELTQEQFDELETDSRIDAYHQEVKQTISAILRANGYHRTKNRLWRMKRMKDIVPNKDVSLPELSIHIQALTLFRGDNDTRLALIQDMEQLKSQFNYDECGPIERMLVDNVLTCYVRMYSYDLKLTSAVNAQEIAFLEERLANSQARFSKAILLYSRVCQLSERTPSILNIAENQQVNFIK